MDKSKPIHLDYAATAPVDPRVLQAMLPDLQDNFGNPASRSHAHGWAAEDAVEIAREHVARVKGEALVVELPRYTKNHAREH